jgi:hypothetical protein
MNCGKDPKHRYDANGHVRKRSDIEVFVEHHQGPDPSNPDQLCSQLATDALVSCHHFLMFCTIVLSLTCIYVVYARINIAKKW